MTQRLFQDAAGTIPAILAGQPVGLSIRAAGQQNASQATALSKPTLARWPMSGVRNLAMGAQAVNSSVWATTNSNQGMTATRIATGVEDSLPYIDFHITGTATAGVFENLYFRQNSSTPAGIGFVGATQAIVRVLEDNTGAGFLGIRVRVSGSAFSGPGTQTEIYNSIEVKPYTDQKISMVSPAFNIAETAFASGSVNIRVTVGAVIDVKIRIKGLQFEVGNAATPLQFNYGPNDITEPGVPDLWHLYNDGGDSLNVILPAGTYGSAHLAIDRSYNVGTVVSDGVTPLTTLTTERQIDAIYRLGEFSAGEREALLKYWQ